MKYLFILIFSVFSFSSYSQDAVPNFDIIINRTETGVELNCTMGCTWQNLSFSNIDKSATFDAQGMLEEGEERDLLGMTLAPFKIKLDYNQEMLTLTGISGTAWERLEINRPKFRPVHINHAGMLSIE